MSRDPSKHEPLWSDALASLSFPPLRGTLEVDTVVVGAGVTGMTAARHLARAGQKVAVVEAGSVGCGETGRTTSHLTVLTDGGAAALRQKHGDTVARAVIKCHHDAMDAIERTCRELSIPDACARVPAYVYSEDKAGVAKVDEERNALDALGVEVRRLPEAPLPFATQAALRVDGQAQLDMALYMKALTQDFIAASGQVYADTRAFNFSDGAPCTLETPGGNIRAHHVILATHTPPNRLAYHAQIFAYRTYALAARCEALPRPALFFDTAEPYHYLRTQRTDQGEVLIVGGCDHKTGKHDGSSRSAALEAFARKRFKVESVARAWSGQVMEPADLLPFVGYNGLDSHTLFASGYSGNGITWGTTAAGMLADAVLGHATFHSDAARMVSSRRLDLGAQLSTIARESIDIPVNMAGDRVASFTRSEAGLRPGEGRVLHRDGKAVALSCDASGVEHAVHATCPHLGGIVRWNADEQSWDCPCHGSRFDAQGRLLNGPALEDLKPA